MSGVIGAPVRFRIPATRDVLVRLYTPINGPAMWPLRSEDKPVSRYLVPAYLSELDPEIAAQIRMTRKNRKELDTPLRGYAESRFPPEVKAATAILAVLVREREWALARNLSLDHAFDGLELWAEAELREMSEFSRSYFKEHYGQDAPENKLFLRFVEVPNQ